MSKFKFGENLDRVSQQIQPLSLSEAVSYPLDAVSTEVVKKITEEFLPEIGRTQSIDLASTDISFDVRNTDTMKLVASAAVTIATITNGYNGQVLTLVFDDANVTLTDDSTGAANTIDLGGADYVSTPNTTLDLVFDGESWFASSSESASRSLIEGIYTAVTVSNTTTETDLVNVTIPANTLGTANAVRLRAYITQVTGRNIETITWRAYYGLSSDSHTDATAVTTPAMQGLIEILLLAQGATNSQKMIMLINLQEDGLDTDANPVWTRVQQSEPSEDSTGNLVIRLTVDWSAAGSSANSVTMQGATVEKLLT